MRAWFRSGGPFSFPMGNLCGVSSRERDEVLFRFQATRMAMCMTESEFARLYDCFRSANRSETGVLRIEELLDFGDLPRTALTERLFDLYREESDGITFKNFALFTWNLCTRDGEGLLIFAFQLYDSLNRGYLDLPDVLNLLCDVFGDDWNKMAGPRKLMRELCEVDVNGKPHSATVTIEKFMLATHNATVVLFPAFEIQVSLQKACLGINFWERLAQRRRDLTARGAFDIKAIVALFNEGRTRETAVVPISERHFIPYIAMYDVKSGAPLFQPPPTPREKLDPDLYDEDGNEYYDKHGNQVDKHGKIVTKKADLEKQKTLGANGQGMGSGEGLATDRSSGGTETDGSSTARSDNFVSLPPSAPPSAAAAGGGSNSTVGANGRVKPTALPVVGGNGSANGSGSNNGSRRSSLYDGDPAALGNGSTIATSKLNLGGIANNGVKTVKGVKQPGDLSHLFAYRMAGGEKGKFNPAIPKGGGASSAAARRGSQGSTGSAGGGSKPIVLPSAGGASAGGSRRDSGEAGGGDGSSPTPTVGALGGTGAGGTDPSKFNRDLTGGLAQLGGVGGPRSRRNSFGTGLSDFTAMQLGSQAVFNERGEVVMPGGGGNSNGGSKVGSRRTSFANGTPTVAGGSSGSGSGIGMGIGGSGLGDPEALARLAGYKLSTSPQGNAPSSSTHGSPEVDSIAASAAARRAASASRTNNNNSNNGNGGAGSGGKGTPTINLDDAGAVMRLARIAGATRS